MDTPAPPITAQPAPQSQDQPQELPISAAAIAPHLTFWQRHWVQNLLPLITSLVIHLAIILVALLIGGVVQKVSQLVVQEQVVVPDASFTDGPVGGIPNPGLGGDPNRAAAQDQFKDAAITSEGLADKPSQTLTASLMGGGAGDTTTEMSIIGTGANVGAGKGNGVGQGSGLGSGAGDGGPIAAFGVPGGGGGVGPKFMGQGTGGNTRSISFICDASGSMINKMAILKTQMRSTIDRLRPVQGFSIFFFKENMESLPKSGPLLLATPENKRRAYDFLDQINTGPTSDPVPALKMAFAQSPQLIFLLTDGEFDDSAKVVATIKEANKENKTRINTILFANQNESDKTTNGDQLITTVLKGIAKDNGGTFSSVDPDQFYNTRN